jgi:hypothetical protein
MIDMIKIHEDRAQRTKRSGYDVLINRSMDWVSIFKDDKQDDDIFFQGDDAAKFICDLDIQYENLQDIRMQTLMLSIAWDYIECID